MPSGSVLCGKTRYVLCVIDYGGLCNQSYDLYGYCIVYRNDPELLAHKLAYADRVAGQMARSVRAARTQLQRVTHVGTGKGKFESVASNWRVPQNDGSILVRSSSTTDLKLQQAPEGVIDPWLRTVAFYRDAKLLAYLHYYATHPQSFYGDARISYDAPGIAREKMQTETGVFQAYFAGCDGNVAMGKYNNGARQVRYVHNLPSVSIREYYAP